MTQDRYITQWPTDNTRQVLWSAHENSFYIDSDNAGEVPPSDVCDE
jgi:hypothetical protein